MSHTGHHTNPVYSLESLDVSTLHRPEAMIFPRLVASGFAWQTSLHTPLTNQS